jgi:hypothetical protein
MDRSSKINRNGGLIAQQQRIRAGFNEYRAGEFAFVPRNLVTIH